MVSGHVSQGRVGKLILQKARLNILDFGPYGLFQLLSYLVVVESGHIQYVNIGHCVFQ